VEGFKFGRNMLKPFLENVRCFWCVMISCNPCEMKLAQIVLV